MQVALTTIQYAKEFQRSRSYIGSIMVMICRVWDVHAATGRYLSSDFIVFDTQGSIAHNFLWLKEGFVYLVKNFTVMPNKDEFRVIRFDDFMLEFNGETTTRKAFLKSKGFTHYSFQLVEIDELEPTNNKYLIDVVGYVTNVGRITLTRTDRLYLSSTSSMLIVDDAKIPLLMRLKTDDSGVPSTKVILPVDNTTLKVGTLENLLMWAQNQKYDVKIDKVRTKKGWNYPSCKGDKFQYWKVKDRYYLYVPFHFSRTFTNLRLQDEEASLGLPTALANIMGTSHILELQSHTYYEHMNYESFTCWKVVIAGRTTHSRFVIPLELLENSTCGIKQNTHLAELMQEVELIIWDEAPMTQKCAFKALDKTLRDILGNPASENRNTTFGGMTVLLGGDFRQIYQSSQKARGQILSRRVSTTRYCGSTASDGKLPAKLKDGEDEPTWIEILEKFLINSTNSSIEQIV
nr:hypothetical protein [Tanacetum cinerariifolium]